MLPLSSAVDDGQAIHLGPERAARRLVLLHGWGADADDLLELGAELLPDAALEGPDAVSLVALRAPLPHPGGAGRQWYELMPQPKWDQLPAARADLRRRLEALASTVPLQRTALLGFSQGAAMALDVATGSATDGDAGEGEAGGALPLASLIACSGYPHPGWNPATSTAKILLTHGEQDPVVMASASEELERRLREAGGTVQRLPFSGGHGIDPGLFPEMRAVLAAGWKQAAAREQAEA